MNIALKTAFIAVALLGCYAEDIVLRVCPLRPGSPALVSFRADRPFNFDQAKAFGGKLNLALSQYVPLYVYSSDKAIAGKKKIQDFLAILSDVRKKDQLDAGAFGRQVKKDFALDLSQDEAQRVVDYPELQNLFEGMMAIENTLMQSKILEEYEPLRGKGTAEVRYPLPIGTVAYPATEFLTLDKARDVLKKQAEQVFWQVDKQVLRVVVAISSAVLATNLKYDQKENDRRLEEIMQRYPSKVIHYDSGEVLVPARKTLTEEDTLLLAANREVEERDFFTSISWILLTMIILTVLYDLALPQIADMERQNRLSCALHYSVLIISILLFKVFLLFTALPVYLIPIGLIPLLVIMLKGSRLAAVPTTLLGCVAAGFMTGRSIQLLLYFIVGGLTVLLASKKMRRRSQVLLPSAAAGTVCALLAAASGLDWRAFPLLNGAADSAASMLSVPDMALLRSGGWAILGGLSTGPVALAILPLLEIVLRTPSVFKISTWTNLEHPLLKELLSRAPGTYQHTMSVANLAQAAGEAIGADVPLMRAGVYFHDIGKMVDPEYFVENQSGAANPHQDLDALQSARIIKDHVKKGMAIGRKAKLPKAILDFIPQHHGTQVLEYFWNKARQNGLGEQAEEKDYRYPGPKPQTVEAAILMIVDAVEAASRTLPERNRNAVEALVTRIMEKRMGDGQLDECSITTQDLARIKASLVDSVAAAFHKRVEYPWQEEEAEKANHTKASSSGIDESSPS